MSPKVFLSYARADDEPFVERLRNDLSDAGVDVWWDRESMKNRGRTFLQELRDAIEDSDRKLIAVIGPSAVESDYVRTEWEHARLFAKGIIPVLRLGEWDLAPAEIRQFDGPDMRSDASYQVGLQKLIGQINEPVVPLGKLTLVPRLPRRFQARPADFAALTDLVLPDNRGPTVVDGQKQATIVQGMGGAGKSVLAAAFARSVDVRRAFRDGIIWLTIGQSANLFSALRSLGAAAGDDVKEYVDIDAAKGRVSRCLEGNQCLIVLDDVWHVRHAEPFINALDTRSSSRLLITTRDAGLDPGAPIHRVGPLDHRRALQLLADWSGEPVEELLATPAPEVAEECGYLPFPLALCGAMRQKPGETPWQDVLDALRESDLEFMKASLPNYTQHRSVFTSLQVSVGALPPDQREMYRQLAVFAFDADFPEASVITLWTADRLRDRDARGILSALAQKALLEITGDPKERWVSLHPLQHDHLRSIAGDQQALHQRLLDAYRRLLPDDRGETPWWNGEDDGHYYQRLVTHLAKAGRHDEIASLLVDHRWLHAKLKATSASEAATDFAELEGEDGHAFDGGNRELIRNALRLSRHVLDRAPDQLPGQLYGRLSRDKGTDVAHLLASTDDAASWPWLRPLKPTLLPPDGPLVGSLIGHKGPAYAVAVTPDGTRILTGSRDRTVKVWDSATGKELHTLGGHTKRVYAVAVTPDGRRAVSGSEDTTCKVWDLGDGAERRTFGGHTGIVSGVAITPDGSRVVSASQDGTLTLWEAESGRVLHSFEGHGDAVWDVAVAVSPDGLRVVSGSGDASVRIWDLESGHELHKLEGHSGPVRGVATTPDGRLLVSAAEDHLVKVWDPMTGKELHNLRGHTGRVYAVAVTPDGRRVYSASWDATVREWDLESGAERRTFRGHAGRVFSVAVVGDGEHVVSASWDNTAKVWDPSQGAGHAPRSDHSNWVSHIAATGDGTQALSASWDGTVKVWDADSGEEVRTLFGPGGRVYGVSVAPDGRRVVSGSEDGSVLVWDLGTENEKPTLSLSGHAGPVRGVEVTPDSQRIVSASADGTLKFWDLATGDEIRTLQGHDGGVHAAAITSDGRHVVSASRDSTLKLWDLEKGSEICTFRAHSGEVFAVVLARGGRHIVSAAEDGTIRLWDMQSGREEHVFEGHTREVRAVAVTPDGRRFVSAAEDATVKVWDLVSKSVVATFTADGPLYACIALGSRRYFAAGASGRIHLLELEGSQEDQQLSEESAGRRQRH